MLYIAIPSKLPPRRNRNHPSQPVYTLICIYVRIEGSKRNVISKVRIFYSGWEPDCLGAPEYVYFSISLELKEYNTNCNSNIRIEK